MFVAVGFKTMKDVRINGLWILPPWLQRGTDASKHVTLGPLDEELRQLDSIKDYCVKL